MPPIEGPITVTTWSMPSLSLSKRYWDWTMSRIVNRGNCMRGWALLLLGEVVRPLLIASVATMKYLVVSSALPGPIRKSRRWWFPDSAVTIRMAFDFWALSVP